MEEDTKKDKKYPVGIQTFSELIEEGYVYVDKTHFIKRLIDEGKFYFLSRPRRFGKSLLLSTIESFFKGEIDLFKGLYIAPFMEARIPNPVIHLDLNNGSYTSLDDLRTVLSANLMNWEREFEITPSSDMISLRFGDVIKAACLNSGRKVVILVDEYDKPMLSAVEDEGLADSFRELLKSFYSNLNTMDRYIEFAMLSGVAKFSKVSIFSDLNNLRDISFEDRYADICGITDNEIDHYLIDGIEKLASFLRQDKRSIYDELKKKYDGYHFSPYSVDIYNPFSLMTVFAKTKFGNYWAESGTPTFLMSLIKNGKWSIKELAPVTVDADELASSGILTRNPVEALYQTGYLTIKQYDPEYNEFLLDYPNEEVRDSFFKFILKDFLGDPSDQKGLAVQEFARAINKGKPEVFISRLNSLLAGLGYSEKGSPEVRFQDALYMLFTLLGAYARVEERTSDGRMDIIVDSQSYIYIFECKIDSSAENAMQQILQKQYWLPYRHGDKKIFLIGINFDSHTRRVNDYQIQELSH